MPAGSDWTSGLAPGFAAMSQTLLAFLPHLLAGIGLLLVGWLLAHLARAVTVRATGRMAGWLPRFVTRGRRFPVFSPTLIGGVVFWLIILCFLAAASQALGLTMFTLWLERIVGYLPVLVAAVAIVLVGLVVSQLAREAVVQAAAELEHRIWLGYSVQAAILATVAVIALELLGLDVTLLVVVAAILIGALAGGLALAFGLGARTEVANLLGARQLRQRFDVGDVIRIDGREGRIVELSDRAVVIETENGHAAVPGRRVAEQGYTAIIEGDSDD